MRALTSHVMRWCTHVVLYAWWLRYCFALGGRGFFGWNDAISWDNKRTWQWWCHMWHHHMFGQLCPLFPTHSKESGGIVWVPKVGETENSEWSLPVHSTKGYDSCVDSKWLIVKVVVQKGCSDRWEAMIGHIGVVSHHLWSLLGVIELTILCAFVCNMGCFHAWIREALLHK